MNKQTKKIKITSTLGFICIIVFIGLIYYLITKAYYIVSQKKEKYIEVFFDINLDIILTSLERCENYYKKLKGEMDIEYDEQEQNDQMTNNNHQLHNQINQKQKDKNLKRNLRAKALSQRLLIKILFFAIILGIFYIVIFIMFFNFLNSSYINVK
jgi:hypothetical protein